MVNETAVREWVAALRSGEYRQDHGQLRSDLGWCCLGVACDLHAKATRTHWLRSDLGTDHKWQYMEHSGKIPHEVAKHLGLSEETSDFLIVLNDGCNEMGKVQPRQTFLQIADWIESRLSVAREEGYEL